MAFLREYLENMGAETDPLSFYGEIFPAGELQAADESHNWKYNGIAVEFLSKTRRKRHTVHDDLEKIKELIAGDNFTIISPVSYVGKSKRADNARFLYALAFDLDGLTKERYIIDLFHQFDTGHLPRPTYLVQSGKQGLHLYYVFKRPIPCFENIKDQLALLKRRLTFKIWNEFTTSQSLRIQYQSVFQGFRMVGTITKQGDRTRAYRVGEEVDVEYLNGFVPKGFRLTEYAYKSSLPLAEAKEKYPEWYERRVVRKEPRGRWTNKRALYDWWYSRMGEITEGHRYFAILCLSVYARKCGVPFAELKRDAYGLLDAFEALTKIDDNHFTVDDIKAGLKAYHDDYVHYPIDEIERVSGLRIERNRRNGRTQDIHLRIARNTLEIMNDENGRALQGRPVGSGTKEEIVKEWQAKNPEGKPKDCIRETRLAKNTVYKWWQK